MALAVRPEDFDENVSAWARGKPPDTPGAPLRGARTLDVAIIGGGFTGCAVARTLAARHPGLGIGLLEACSLGNGASGRNGGMVLNWVNGHASEDPDELNRVFSVTKSGIDLVAERAPEGAFQRGGCLEVYTSPARAEKAARRAAFLQQAGIPVRWLDRAELGERLRLRGAEGALLDPTAGVLDGVAFLRAERPRLLAAGVEVFEGTPVERVDVGRPHRLSTPEGEVRAPVLVLATNAWTPKLGFFRDGILPLHSHVRATGPLSAEQRAAMGWSEVGAFSDDMDRISYASLSPSAGLLFGGGSNASYAYPYGGPTVFPGDRAPGLQAVEARLRAYLPEVPPTPIHWTGTLGVTLSRVCTMGRMEPGILYALGFSGHGVALGNLAGEVLADLHDKEDGRWIGLPFYQQRLLPIPPEPFRWLGYQVFTRLTGRSPRRSL